VEIRGREIVQTALERLPRACGPRPKVICTRAIVPCDLERQLQPSPQGAPRALPAVHHWRPANGRACCSRGGGSPRLCWETHLQEQGLHNPPPSTPSTGVYGVGVMAQSGVITHLPGLHSSFPGRVQAELVQGTTNR
jgi:hypothetical protein